MPNSVFLPMMTCVKGHGESRGVPCPFRLGEPRSKQDETNQASPKYRSKNSASLRSTSLLLGGVGVAG